MQKLKYILFILCSFPTYIVFNNIVYFLSGFAIARFYTEIHLVGSYCELNKQTFTASNLFPYSYVTFILIRVLVFSLLFLKSKHHSIIAKALLHLFLFDTISILIYLINTAFHLHIFNVFYSYAFVFLLSAKYLFSAFVIPIIVCLTQFWLLKKSKSITINKQLGLMAFISSCSAVLWWAVNELY